MALAGEIARDVGGDGGLPDAPLGIGNDHDRHGAPPGAATGGPLCAMLAAWMSTPPRRPRARTCWPHTRTGANRGSTAACCEAARGVPGVDVQDLYAALSRLRHRRRRRTGAACAAAPLLVLLHPIQWYSMPALMKLWLDEVLTHGWAYGHQGTALQGKDLWLVATTGGPEASYHPQGYNRYFFDAFLPPYEQTAALCGMRFLPPLVLHGAQPGEPGRDVDAHVAVFARAPAQLSAMARDGRACRLRGMRRARGRPPRRARAGHLMEHAACLAVQQPDLPGRRRDRGAAVARARPGLDHRLPRRRHRRSAPGASAW